jgi:hypothetical protein
MGFMGCAFQGLGKEGRKACRETNAKLKNEQKAADVDMTKAMVETLNTPTNASASQGSSALPIIIVGLGLVAATVVAILVAKKMKKVPKVK